MKLFNTSENKEKKYSTKVSIPQYLPNDRKPNVSSLYDHKKYSQLLHEIYNSNVSEEEKNFLRLAATRHIVFDYSLIADYYANSDKEMQELMEHSGLVIIDLDDAIANGYVKLSEKMRDLVNEARK